MPIPPFTQFGFIPPGTHICNIGDIRGQFLFNDRRQRLWIKFEEFHEYVNGMNCFSAYHFYGSFFSMKEAPVDIDVALEFGEFNEGTQMIDTNIFEKGWIKEKYEVDITLREPRQVEYKMFAPPGFTFTSDSLYTFRRLKKDEVLKLAPVLKKHPSDFWQDEFKGVLRVIL